MWAHREQAMGNAITVSISLEPDLLVAQTSSFQSSEGIATR